MIDCTHQFILQLFSAGGESLGRSVIEADWLAVVEHAHFEAIRAGTLPALCCTPPAKIEPAWDRDRGRPWVESVRVTVRGDDGTVSSAEIPVSCFEDQAKSAAKTLVKDGALTAGETYRYRITAHSLPAPPDPPSPGGTVTEIEPIARPLPITERSLDPLLEEARPIAAETDDLPVFLPQRIIDETRALVRAAGDVETGGILLGRLHRDTGPDGPLFVELTAQVPARHVERTATSLSLTPATWAAAQAALDLRRAGESFMGWWHSHPDWCRRCTDESRRQCALNRIFFSRDDVAVQRTVFPRAYQVALLLSDRPAGILPTLFGWRQGRVVARGFHLLGSAADVASPSAAIHDISIGGTEHAERPATTDPR